MKFERQIEEDTRLGITPLIDIVFLLLIFLVTTSHFDQAVGITVTLPKTQSMPIRLTQKGALGYDSAHVRIPPDPVRISESFS